MQSQVISLVGFTSTAAIKEYLDEFADMSVELSYKMDRQFLDEVAPLVEGRVASVHACCPQEPIFPNFGSHDKEVLQTSYRAVEESFKTAIRFQASIVVLHPGYVTDLGIPSDNKMREALLADPSFRQYVFKKEGSICYPSYPHSDVYLRHARQARGELPKVALLGKGYGVRLAVENLNPRVGYLLQTPQEMVALTEGNPDLFLCLDVGHLWISSCLYGFDYFAGLRTILETQRVINCHLHANSSQALTEQYADDHHSLDKYDFPYEEVVALLLETDANLVLETVENPRANTMLLKGLMQKN
ncbi:MAG: TIM barrel protein [Sphaerochaeta sp.]|nr:TIM barrel protein [Sphaerochaeta sp.]